MINYDEIVKDIVREVTRIEVKLTRKIAAEVLGVSIDSWGDIKEVKPSLITEVSKNSQVQESLNLARAKIAAEVSKPLPVKTINSIARKVKEKLIRNLEDEIYQEIFQSESDAIKEAIREKIISDSKLAPYMVAGRIKGIVK